LRKAEHSQPFPAIIYSLNFKLRTLASNNTIAGTTGVLYSEGESTQGALGVQANYTASDTYTVFLS